jgi:hypothetical protein
MRFYILVYLSTAGFKDSQRETSNTRKLGRFRACYGPMPKTASDIFGWIQEEDRAGVFHISKPNAVYFLELIFFGSTRTILVQARTGS